jgi:hypothetical protein
MLRNNKENVTKTQRTSLAAGPRKGKATALAKRSSTFDDESPKKLTNIINRLKTRNGPNSGYKMKESAPVKNETDQGFEWAEEVAAPVVGKKEDQATLKLAKKLVVAVLIITILVTLGTYNTVLAKQNAAAKAA